MKISARELYRKLTEDYKLIGQTGILPLKT
jgi:hypothetical protein